MNQVKVRYTGTALPTGATTETLFTTANMGAAAMAILGLARLTVAIKNSHSGTLKLYKSQDRSTTSNPSTITNWQQIAESAVAAAAATGENIYDYLVEPYYDVKLDWLNGGVTQTTFLVDMALSPERSPAD